jgi:hypothetical protein
MGHILANVNCDAPCFNGNESVNGSNVELDTEGRPDKGDTGKNPGAA